MTGMVYRINLQGVLKAYSEDTLSKITDLAENEELFDYISALVNTGLAVQEIHAKIDTLMELAKDGSISVPSLANLPPVIEDKNNENESIEIEKVTLPMQGSASAALNRLRKNHKKM